jgi:hypothetical protein
MSATTGVLGLKRRVSILMTLVCKRLWPLLWMIMTFSYGFVYDFSS